MDPGVERETEQQRQEREAKQKAKADATAMEPPQPPRPISEQNFLQYMQFVEENRRRDQEQQNKFMQDLAGQAGIAGRDNARQGVNLSEFQNTRPFPFATAPEPMDAEDWLTDTERKLKTVGCSEEEIVRYASYLLTGPAASWWENIIAIHPTTHVFSWEEFKEKFREHHVPESIMELKRQEFEKLEQGSTPVMKYIRDFSRLSRYAVDEFSTEEKRKKRFLRGLNPYVKMQMRPFSTQGF
jgi:hypothetical protein